MKIDSAQISDFSNSSLENAYNQERKNQQDGNSGTEQNHMKS